jgi:hypothetical protein
LEQGKKGISEMKKIINMDDIYCRVKPKEENNAWVKRTHKKIDTDMYEYAIELCDTARAIEAPAGYRIVSLEDQKRCKFPLDCVVKYTSCGRLGWINPSYKNWRDDEPDRHYAVPADYTFAEDRVNERWAFNTHWHNITPIVKGTLWTQETDVDGWIEITAEQKEYLENKPKAEAGFEWVLKAPESGETIMSPDQFTGSPKHIRTWPHEFGCQIDYLNRIRWVKVPVEQEPCFVEYPIFYSESRMAWMCIVEHQKMNDRFLHELPSIVGFTGDILFRYSDGTEQWRYAITDRNRDGTPATPIAARFYINGETK